MSGTGSSFVAQSLLRLLYFKLLYLQGETAVRGGCMHIPRVLSGQTQTCAQLQQ